MRFGQGGRPDALYPLEDRNAALVGELCRAHDAGGPLTLGSVRRHMHRVQAFQATGLSHLHRGRFESVPRYAGSNRPSEQAAPTSADFVDASRHPLTSRAHDAPARLRLSAAGVPFQLSF